jgi:hypothetical protein
MEFSLDFMAIVALDSGAWAVGYPRSVVAETVKARNTRGKSVTGQLLSDKLALGAQTSCLHLLSRAADKKPALPASGHL